MSALSEANYLYHEMLTSSLQLLISNGAYYESKSRKIKKTGNNEQVECRKDILIQSSKQSSLIMDVFKPKTDPAEKLPVIVHLRCDGYVYGDRSRSRRFAELLADRGYLVFCIDYRPVIGNDLKTQLKDVLSGLNAVSESFTEYSIDPDRIFMTADPTAGFLALYVSAMFRSEKLRKAIRCRTPLIDFKAVGIISGFFYLKRTDIFGMICADMYVSSPKMNARLLQYMDPEHPEIIKNIPPIFMVTGSSDILQDDTLKLGKVLETEYRSYKIIDYNSKKVDHAFVVRNPDGKKSRKTISRMLSWFEKMAVNRREADEIRNAQQKNVDAVNRKIEDGTIINQKLWSFLEELNSVTDERLDAKALICATRNYTYRQFFRAIRKYAEVFSALKITGKNNSRVGLIGGSEPESFFAFYALNMTGARISGINFLEFVNYDRLKKLILTEKLTDLFISDTYLNPRQFAILLKDKESLGLRSILVCHSPKAGICSGVLQLLHDQMNYSSIKALPDALYIEGLIDRYEGTPICYAKYDPDEVTVVLHTSGTTKGVSKPIPYTDSEINAGALHFLQSEEFRPKSSNAVSVHCLPDMSACYGVVDQLHMPLSFGCAVVATYMAFFEPKKIPELIRYYHVNVLFITGMVLESLLQLPIVPGNYYASLDFIAVGGTYLSKADRKTYSRYLKRFGCPVGVTNGYGLSEACGACIISPGTSKDDTIGFPLPGISVIIRDEETGTFCKLDEGPRTGTLYVSSASVSYGKLDGETIIEKYRIEDKDYICTYDLVKVNKDMSLTYIGRENRFFVNNDGVKFDAGLAETKITAQPTVENCAFVPYYDKWAKDTVPLLCIKFNQKAGKGKAEAVKVLTRVFLEDKSLNDSSLPCNVLITKKIPYNTNGKVNVYKVTSGQVDGKMYNVKIERDGDRIVSIHLEKVNKTEYGNSGYMKGNATL
ncbi:MAG: AMP-binding protein [Eubacterium sp.]|nr:AMP-binding protein [Eubacterium sp.]